FAGCCEGVGPEYRHDGLVGHLGVCNRHGVDTDLQLVVGATDDFDTADAVGRAERRQEFRLRDAPKSGRVGVFTRGQAELVNRELLEVDALDRRLLRVVRQRDASDRVAELFLAGGHVVAIVVLRDHDREVAGRDRLRADHAGETGNNLRDRLGDLLVNRLRGRARDDRHGGEDGHLDVRDQLHLEPGDTEDAGEGDQDRQEDDDGSLPEREVGKPVHWASLVSERVDERWATRTRIQTRMLRHRNICRNRRNTSDRHGRSGWTRLLALNYGK